MAPIDLEITQAMLLGLIGAGEADSLSELARLLGVDRSTLQRNLKLLEEAGLVNKVRIAPNRIKPELSAAGQTKIREASEAWQQAQDSLTAELGEAGADTIRTQMKTLRKAVHKAGAS
ncbi:MarR family transcriptional regulator [Roseibium hamelinense]|nr:MarR family transcriptional regulator [Roseibium hamelinense]